MKIKLLPIILAFLMIADAANAAVTTLYPAGDTKIVSASPTTNYNADTTCASYSGGSACLLKFDLTGITSASVVSAEFKIFGESRWYQHNVTLSRLLRNFTSTEATWNVYSTGNNWGAAGATDATDFTTTNQQTGATPDNGWVTFDATNLVKDMIDNSDPNLIFKGADGNLGNAYRMSEYAGTDYDPQLIIRTGVPGQVTVWHVRTDGGTCGLGNQCEGTTDAAYDGSGINEACACSTPQALNNIMHGEDIAIVHSGSYATTQISIPSGSSSTLTTKFYGEGWDTGCASPPELWASAPATNMINLTDVSNVDIRCLEITDHSNTANFNRGIYAEDSSNVNLKNLDIHGGNTGIMAGRLTNWDLTNVQIRNNHLAGWDGDIVGADYNTGVFNFTNVTITYNGCYESATTGLPIDCCGQDNGCYGDGFGTGLTGGKWNFIGCNISHNASDGLDLLYSDDTTEVNVSRSLMEGNTGNQLKIPNKARVENSLINGNCLYFYGQTFTRAAVDNAGYEFPYCRAFGNTIEVAYRSDTVPVFYNNTITGNGDVLVDVTGTCTSGTDIIFQNNIMRGGRQGLDDSSFPACNGSPGDDSVSVFYNAGNCASDFVETYNICYGFKEGENSCNGTGSTDTVDPGFTGVILQGPYSSPGYFTDDDYWAQLYISAATGAADETAPVTSSNDYQNFARGEAWDIGALEFDSTPAPPSCQTDCSQCDSSGTCAASAQGCFWQTNGTCGTTIDPCNVSCLNCLTSTTCAASTIPCYYWSTNQCQPTTEPPAATCDTDCTLCADQSTCEASAFPCFYQFDTTCKSTEDPCNTYCGSCSADNCASSTIGCSLWPDNVCRQAALCTTYTDAASCSAATGPCYPWTDDSCRYTAQGTNTWRGTPPNMRGY